MGRTPLSALPLLLRLRMHGYPVGVFGYSTAWHTFAAIRDRLQERLVRLAAEGPYALVGHSLGGVLLRSALRALPAGTRQPEHLFLLGSPMRSARLARRLRNHRVYRLVTGDCGQLLACETRMQGIGSVEGRSTAIMGVKGFRGTRSAFLDEPNDGVVGVSELHAEWLQEEVRVPVVHTFLPASGRVAAVLLERLQGQRTSC